jgi:hypothetical protein
VKAISDLGESGKVPDDPSPFVVSPGVLGVVGPIALEQVYLSWTCGLDGASDKYTQYPNGYSGGGWAAPSKADPTAEVGDFVTVFSTDHGVGTEDHYPMAWGYRLWLDADGRMLLQASLKVGGGFYEASPVAIGRGEAGPSRAEWQGANQNFMSVTASAVPA